MTWCLTAISAEAFWCMFAMLAPFAFLLPFLILMWVRASLWKSALSIADSISSSISLGSGTLSSRLRMAHQSAMLEHVVGAGAELASFVWFRGGSVSHRLVGVGIQVVAPFAADVALGVGVCAGLGAGDGFGFGDSFGFGCGMGMDVSWVPGGRCWRSSGFSGPPVWVRSWFITSFRPTPLVSAFLSSLWSRSVAATAIATMSLMPLLHCGSTWWYKFCIFFCSSNHNFVPRHCASCSAV